MILADKKPASPVTLLIQGWFLPKGTPCWDPFRANREEKTPAMIKTMDWCRSEEDFLDLGKAAWVKPEEAQPDEQTPSEGPDKPAKKPAPTPLAISMRGLEADEGGNIPELGIVAGQTTKDVFIAESISAVPEFRIGLTPDPNWAVEWMNEGDDLDLVRDLPELAKTLTELTKLKARERARFISETPEAESQTRPQPWELLSLWEPVTSRDWESGITELEALRYVGPAQVIARKLR